MASFSRGKGAPRGAIQLRLMLSDLGCTIIFEALCQQQKYHYRLSSQDTALSEAVVRDGREEDACTILMMRSIWTSLLPSRLEA